MFSIEHQPSRLCDGYSRRELLRAGGLSLLGLSLPELLAARETAPFGVPPTDKTFGRAKSVIFLYLAGGPPQHETFDPKPQAPAEIRGPFKPISTNIPGIQFCELLPRTARICDKLAVVRSMATDDNTHSSSSAWVLTGYKYQGPNARQIRESDWPYFGSVVKKLKPSEVLPPLSTVWIPDLMRLNENVTPAGQTGGFLGGAWDPDRFVGDPNDPEYRVEGLRLTDMTPLRLQRRKSLLSQIDSHFGQQQRGRQVQVYDQFQQQAFDLLTSGTARKAFDIATEPKKLRERYGRNAWGQCVLLARRLVEAGVRLVHVQWPRMPGDNAVDNPLWDTHAQNADRLEDVLCPQFDVGFSALVEDLDRRGLLEETLVVAIGEFGRTPRINAKGGRDHWGPVFSFAMAGAGISGGQVLGASDRKGAYPADDRVEPGDLTATIFHLLGIHYQGKFRDRTGQEHRLTEGSPMFKLLGTQPVTGRRIAAGGEVSRVPPYVRRLLTNTDFSEQVPLQPVTGSSRPKRWRATPLVEDGAGGFGVKLVENPAGGGKGKLAAIGFGYDLSSRAKIAAKTQALLAQEVRSPFAGRFTLTARLCGSGLSPDYYDRMLLENFEAKLIFFQFTEREKQPTDRKELASTGLRPRYAPPGGPEFQEFALTKEFVNPKPGSNFSFGLGLGVALVLEKTSPGELDLSAAEGIQRAFLLVDEIKLEFTGKERNDDVKV